MTIVKTLSFIRSIKEKHLIIHVYHEPSGVKQAYLNIFLYWLEEQNLMTAEIHVLASFV